MESIIPIKAEKWNSYLAFLIIPAKAFFSSVQGEREKPPG
jgi:hypothetical protein